MAEAEAMTMEQAACFAWEVGVCDIQLERCLIDDHCHLEKSSDFFAQGGNGMSCFQTNTKISDKVMSCDQHSFKCTCIRALIC